MRTDIKLRNRILRMKKVVEDCRLYWKNYPSELWTDVHYESRKSINDHCDQLTQQIESLYEESMWLGEDSWDMAFEDTHMRFFGQPSNKEEA